MHHDYLYGLEGCYKEDLDLCVEEAVVWNCVWRPEPKAASVEVIVFLGKSVGMAVHEGDLKKLTEEHSEELKQLQTHAEVL